MASIKGGYFMKSIIILTLLLSSSLWAMEKVPLLNGRIYIPDGFDDNDLIEIAVSGRLPDLCHRNPTYEITRQGNEFKVNLYAYFIPRPEGCKKVSVPYLDTISLGILPKGNYVVALQSISGPQNKIQFHVEGAKSSLQDDFLYGNVMGIVENDNNRLVELIGTNPVNCLEFRKLESEIQGGVIVLRPQFEEIGQCEDRPTPFSIRYEVPYMEGQPRGVLLHVRVMNGRSYNYLYQNRL